MIGGWPTESNRLGEVRLTVFGVTFLDFGYLTNCWFVGIITNRRDRND